MSQVIIIMYIDLYENIDIHKIDLMFEKLSEYSFLLIDDMNERDSSVRLIELLKINKRFNVKYISYNKKQGFSKAVNAAILDYSSDLYFLFIDTFVYMDHKQIEILLSNINKSERNGFALPRFNDCEFLSYPYSAYRDGTGISNNDRKMIYQNTVKNLYSFAVIPFAFSYCVLIKPMLIQKFNGFDERFTTATAAIMAFSLNLNQYGYSSIVCNKVYVELERKRKLEIESEEISLIYKEYSYLEDVVTIYKSTRIQAQDYFSDLLDASYHKKKKVLFYLITLPPLHNGTSEHQISLLDAFYNLFHEKYDITILTNETAAVFHQLNCKYTKICYPETIQRTFHIGIIPMQLFYMEHIIELNRLCLKIVNWMLDIILLRCNYFLPIDKNTLENVHISFRLVDGMILNSNDVKNDMQSFFNDYGQLKKIPMKVIYPSIKRLEFKGEETLPFDKFYLVFGNSFFHKSLALTVEELKGTAENFIIVGLNQAGFIANNIFSYCSGNLKDELIETLYTKCGALIFPSQYEGFGIPIFTALNKGKNVILNNNSLNRELVNSFPELSKYMYFFDLFKEIPEIIQKLERSNTYEKGQFSWTWDNVAVECEKFLSEILLEETDGERLKHRFELVNHMNGLMRNK